MATWRERGYVPDSDDDEEEEEAEADPGLNHDNTKNFEIGSTGQPSHARRLNETTHDFPSDVAIDTTKQCDQPSGTRGEDSVSNNVDRFFPHLHPPENVTAKTAERNLAHKSLSSLKSSSPPATKLEVELHEGLQVVQGMLRPLGNEIQDDIDSPLSSLPSSLQSSPRQVPLAKGRPNVVPDIENLEDLTRNGTSRDMSSLATGRRSFRPRAPIQLHPYALEDARYRQSLRDRGVRPVRLPGESSGPQNHSEEDSQGAETYEGSPMDSDHIPPSGPVQDVGDDESPSPVRGGRTHPLAPDVPVGGGFPELSNILKDPPPKRLSGATKRLKTKHHLSTHRGGARDDEFRIFDLPADDDVSTNDPRMDNTVFRIPPSPPRSRGTLSSQDSVLASSNEAGPDNSPPALLPTPLLSSENHGRKRVLVETLSSSDSENILISDDPTASSSPSDSSEDDSQGVQRMRRKMRGVLPASWLKLDITQQKNRQTYRHQGRSPFKSVVEKGIAQRISTSVTRRNRGDTFHFPPDVEMLYASSESDSDEPAVARMDGLDHEVPGEFEGDVVEDDVVDAVIAPRARKAPIEKRQLGLKGAWSRSERAKPGRGRDVARHSHPAAGATGWASKSTERGRPYQTVKNKHKRPQMTVLDAPGLRDKDVPRFLRIAARRQEGFSERVTQDPSTKFFKLATTADTLDVNEELGRWTGRRSKNYPPALSSLKSPRRPPSITQLRRDDGTRLGNAAGILHPDSTQLTSLKENTKITLDRIRKCHDQIRPLPPESHSNPQIPSTALLDYFEPQLIRRNQRGSGQHRAGLEGRTEIPESTVIPSNPLPLLRRIPKPARGTREPRNLSPGPKSSTSSARTPHHRRSRVPRKQRPMAFHEQHGDIRSGQTEGSLVSGDLLDLTDNDEDDIISQAIKHPPGRKHLSINPSILTSTLIRDGLLQTTLSSMENLSRLVIPNNNYTSITAPKSDQSWSCTGWSAEAGTIIQKTFAEIRSVVSKEAGQALLLTKCGESVESIVRYVNQSLFFNDLSELDGFTISILDQIDQLVQVINLSECAKADSHASGILSILSRVMVLGFQIAKITTMTGVGDTSRMTSLVSRKTVTTLAWSLALRKEQIGGLFSYIAGLSGSESVSDASDFRTSLAQIEAIILVYRLGAGQSWVDHLNHFLSVHVNNKSVGSFPAETLAYTILILACIYSVVGADDLVANPEEGSESLNSSGFVVLPAAMTEFLKFFVKEKKSKIPQRKRDRRMDKLRQFGLVASQWCLLLARCAKGDVVDHLLKQMFKHYSDKTNNMLDFFSRTSIEVPAFLDRQAPASELVPEPADTDFHLFLKMTAFTLEIPPDTDFEDTEKLKRLGLRKLSLVFSLLPNSGRDAGTDRPLLVEEHEPLMVQDLAAMANRYILFSTLYNYSPVGFKPDLSTVKNLIEFGKAHDAVCTLALRCWASMVKSVIQQPIYQNELHELAQWIQEMFFQISDKLAQIPPDDGISHQEDGRWVEFEAHRQNRETANARLSKIAQTYAEAIELCLNEDQARSLLKGNRLHNLIHLCSAGTHLDDQTINRIFEVLTGYLKKASYTVNELTTEMRPNIRGAIVSQLDRSLPPLDDAVLVSIVETWFAMAKTMTEGVESWDVYLSTWGSHSFSQMAVTNTSRQCHILMMSKVAADRVHVEKDPYFFLSEWLSSILLPETDLKFEHCLTNQLVETVPGILALGSLRETIASDSSRFLSGREDLIEHRLTIIRHVIRSIYHLQHTDDATASYLTKENGEQLLRVICETIKETWRKLSGDARAAFAVFIRRVKFELSEYTFPHYQIDPWFNDPLWTNFDDQILRVESLFIRQPNDAEPIENEHRVEVFRLACEVACIRGEQEKFIEHVAMTFAADNHNYIDDNGVFLLDIPEQLFFIKAVFPAYIERAFQDTTPTMLLASPVVSTAKGILMRLETRIDLEDQSRMEEFAEVIAALMFAAVEAMQGTRCNFTDSFGWELQTLDNLVCLCAAACSRWALLHQLFPESEPISALQGYIQMYAQYAYEYASSALNRPCFVTDPEFWARFPDSETRSAKDFGFVLSGPELSDVGAVAGLREFAADDLEYTGRMDWVRTGLSQNGPVWHSNRHKGKVVVPRWPSNEDGKLGAGLALGELIQGIKELGLE
ncbi:uncharacterized protein Z518_07578 [Rhinocladiella mackenziei CBS 650.93]|uniref:Mus7/MMS22 family-domain-containing protein n=1 Tax=Rhinocladiella mackenziei CBS 650.93 TaxID=1442369 RepID=A0A0D2J4W9_9EURO|nr:uncharacterized protein Z518_07578 [Rhinocladiella mackenziei CBS 650.93]KIX04025.1 hypothetical protein Z518_07578 [Rhinocladiella mackenziei CBS 650.93]